MADVGESTASGAGLGFAATGGNPLGAIIGGALGFGSAALSGGFGPSEQFQSRQTQRDMLEAAHAHLTLGEGSFFNRQLGALQEMQSPFLAQLLASQDLAGMGAANSARAGLGRAGLGSTGLGSALGAGLQAGAAFQGNTLRAQLMRDQFEQVAGLQGLKAQMVMQSAGNMAQLGSAPRPDPFASLAQGAFGGSELFGSFPKD